MSSMLTHPLPRPFKFNLYYNLIFFADSGYHVKVNDTDFMVSNEPVAAKA